MTDDATLLHRYVATHNEAAFAEFVQRRIGLVYSTALRQLAGDDHLARDATQLVFIDAARKARVLARHTPCHGEARAWRAAPPLPRKQGLHHERCPDR